MKESRCYQEFKKKKIRSLKKHLDQKLQKDRIFLSITTFLYPSHLQNLQVLSKESSCNGVMAGSTASHQRLKAHLHKWNPF